MPEYETLQIFAANLRALIARNNTPQRHLAQQIGVSQQIVSQWVQGKKMPRMDKVQALAEYFHCSVKELISEPSERNTDEIPLYGTVACGSGASMAILENISKPAFVQADCAFKTTGESMASCNIHSGDIVFVQSGVIKEGAIHAVRIEDSYFLKKLYMQPDGFLLISDEPPITVHGEQEDYQIIGKAVYLLQAI